MRTCAYVLHYVSLYVQKNASLRICVCVSVCMCVCASVRMCVRAYMRQWQLRWFFKVFRSIFVDLLRDCSQTRIWRIINGKKTSLCSQIFLFKNFLIFLFKNFFIFLKDFLNKIIKLANLFSFRSYVKLIACKSKFSFKRTCS